MSKVLALLVFLTATQASAQSSRLHAEEDYMDSWALTLGAAVTTTRLVHNESSTVPDYTTTGRSVDVPDVRMSFSFMKEFLNPSTFSFTVQILGGTADSEGAMGGENLERFTEKLSSIHYGGALSVNYNLYNYGFKIQPYVGVSFLQEVGEYNLTHSESGVTLNTIHEFETTFASPTLGVRVFDADVSLMSYFEVSSPTILSETFTPKAQASGGDIDITSNTEITRSQVAFSVGFGYFF